MTSLVHHDDMTVAHRAAKCIALLHFALRKYREVREFAQAYMYWTLLANGTDEKDSSDEDANGISEIGEM
ncbi:unnamed protein product [Gongylonema pulchrum]|uniref:N-terminal acetyltransferase A complex auxiliary subunit NAA15-like n=1 Tax=Gongylonema pulchrum TaxID=637853 RepID=A0A183E0S2_9BILA|nr:unnamed protein product [Gongylonema pulchrum]